MSGLQRTARNVEEFVNIVLEARERWRLGKFLPWCRGQANAEWPLRPKFYRQTRADRVDDEIREEFIKRAPALHDGTCADKWDWYFLMQHYRAPTRLLDWTESALLGLYFAVRENPVYPNMAVWVLDPWALNKRVVKNDEVVPPGDPGTSQRDRRRYDRWLPDRFTGRARRPTKPVAIYPGHTTRRIGAQRSCFTIHGSDPRGLEQMKHLIEGSLLKITIPSWNATNIRQTLEICGIDETTIFPDLEGLSKAIENKWTSPGISQIRPHRNVFTRLRPSKIDKGGVGVFAIRKIRKGTQIFKGDNDEMIWINETELPRSPKETRQLYDDFAIINTCKGDRLTRYGCPLNFNRLTVAWYINDSDRPNVACDQTTYDFYALRDIEMNEELTVDYSTYSENPR